MTDPKDSPRSMGGASVTPAAASHDVRVLVLFYSMYGHVHRLAEAVADGAREVPGVSVTVRQVPELVPDSVLDATGARAARDAFAHVPVATVDELPAYDAIIFGTPTRFGNMAAQMRNFLDQTGALWAQRALVGKVGSVFVSTQTQHGGQEVTALTFHATLLHHGMIVVGVPYSAPGLSEFSEISGGSPYGAGALTLDGSRQAPTANELAVARFQGRHVASITRALVLGRGAMSSPGAGGR